MHIRQTETFRGIVERNPQIDQVRLVKEIESAQKYYVGRVMKFDLTVRLARAFHWASTNQGYKFWADLHNGKGFALPKAPMFHKQETWSLDEQIDYIEGQTALDKFDNSQPLSYKNEELYHKYVPQEYRMLDLSQDENRMFVHLVLLSEGKL